MPLVKRVSALQIGGIEPSRARVVEHPGTQAARDPVVGVVATERGQHQNQHESPDGRSDRRTYRTGHEEEAVTRQKRRDHQASLGPDDEEQDQQKAATVLAGKLQQVHIEVQQQVNEVGHCVVDLRAARRPAL